MTNRTALITCVERYMGLAIQKKFESQGINVVSGGYPMTTQDECEQLVNSVDQIDILVANLAEPPMTAPVQSIDNDDWNKLIDMWRHHKSKTVQELVEKCRKNLSTCQLPS